MTVARRAPRRPVRSAQRVTGPAGVTVSGCRGNAVVSAGYSARHEVSATRRPGAAVRSVPEGRRRRDRGLEVRKGASRGRRTGATRRLDPARQGPPRPGGGSSGVAQARPHVRARRRYASCTVQVALIPSECGCRARPVPLRVPETKVPCPLRKILSPATSTTATPPTPWGAPPTSSAPPPPSSGRSVQPS